MKLHVFMFVRTCMYVCMYVRSRRNNREKLFNFLGFDFGVRQNGSRVMHVELPPWAKNNRRLFILIHRQVTLIARYCDFL